jgi:hypothetical protein
MIGWIGYRYKYLIWTSTSENCELARKNFQGLGVSKSVQYLPLKSVSFASQVRHRNYKNSNIAKIAGKFGRSFLAKLANFTRFSPLLALSISKTLKTLTYPE